MTIQDFNNAIDTMRKAYRFEDKYTEIESIYDIVSQKTNRITLRTYDNATETEIIMSRKVEHIDR